ncbi:hypothetical protein [Paenimyroides viscosum]|uniref:Uncharacterized protein n=1 Tax=Paenimyroides viscosum TaxID=2488729 RepID=A0A3P1AN87_9FLAO|nr:hypothetical protein [Paenimyroides viscosum]RRA89343.1 hypothetical protein EG242_14370 [Paenimyroides viscosum]
MSYDLYFYKKKSSNQSEKDIINYLNNSEYLTAEENETQWSYFNEETGVYFGIDLNEPNTETEDLEIWDNFSEYENLNINFTINFIRPNFFGYESFPILEKIIEDLDVYLLNPQDEIDPDNPQQFEKGYLENQWIRHNEQLIIQHFSEFQVEYFDKEKSDYIWNYSLIRNELQENLEEDIFVPGYFLLKSKIDNQIYRVCVWPKHIPIILPSVDFVIVQKEYRKLFKKVEESGLVSIQQINEMIGNYFENFEYDNLKMRVIKQQNADKIEKEFNKLIIESQVKDFGESISFDSFVNVKP